MTTSLPPLNQDDLGDNIPKRGGTLAPKLAKTFLKARGWQIVGSLPNIKKAVLLAVPHTSNIDGLYAIPTLLALDLDIKIMGKKELFKNPILGSFLRWAGIIPIDRDNKGSVLQASIAQFEQADQLFLGLAPEGTRDYTSAWKSGFYYLAMGAHVPIIPIAMDYKTKQVRFMEPFYPTGDIEADLPKIYQYYQGVVPKHPERLSLPLQQLK